MFYIDRYTSQNTWKENGAGDRTGWWPVTKDSSWWQLPLMCNCAEWLTTPAELFTQQVYSPACTALTESMLKVLIRLFNLDISIPRLLSSKLLLLRDQDILMGRSPLMTEHWTATKSPALDVSSPNENGKIWGGTSKRERTRMSLRVLCWVLRWPRSDEKSDGKSRDGEEQRRQWQFPPNELPLMTSWAV